MEFTREFITHVDVDCSENSEYLNVVPGGPVEKQKELEAPLGDPHSAEAMA